MKARLTTAVRLGCIEVKGNNLTAQVVNLDKGFEFDVTEIRVPGHKKNVGGVYVQWTDGDTTYTANFGISHYPVNLIELKPETILDRTTITRVGGGYNHQIYKD